MPNILIDIDGVTVVRLVVSPDEPPVATLFAASGFKGDSFYPAESITIAGEEELRRLRDGLNIILGN
jgi:hypothetical protein